MRIEFDGAREVALALLDERGHLLHACGGGERACARRVVIFLQEREDGVRALIHIDLRVGLLELQHAVAKLDAFELRAKQ